MEPREEGPEERRVETDEDDRPEAPATLEGADEVVDGSVAAIDWMGDGLEEDPAMPEDVDEWPKPPVSATGLAGGGLAMTPAPEARRALGKKIKPKASSRPRKAPAVAGRALGRRVSAAAQDRLERAVVREVLEDMRPAIDETLRAIRRIVLAATEAALSDIRPTRRGRRARNAQN